VTRYGDILEAIGNTPLVRLSRCAPANGAELWVKLEYRNPTGSMKDRMALAMIEGAERDGLLSAGDTVVELTGGSTGPALALVCRAKGYRTLIVMADCFTEERFQLMRALGAEIDVIPSAAGPPKATAQDIDNMVARAAELGRSRASSGGRRHDASTTPPLRQPAVGEANHKVVMVLHQHPVERFPAVLLGRSRVAVEKQLVLVVVTKERLAVGAA